MARNDQKRGKMRKVRMRGGGVGMARRAAHARKGIRLINP